MNKSDKLSRSILPRFQGVAAAGIAIRAMFRGRQHQKRDERQARMFKLFMRRPIVKNSCKTKNAERYFVKISLGIFFVIFAVQNAFSAIPDTIRPTYKWISPLPLTIITTNSIRLCVEPQDNENGSGISKVIFNVEYTDKKGRRTTKVDIGEVLSFPYEMIWDCSLVPDQNLGRLAIRCRVIDNAGNEKESPQNEIPVVLDRNLLYKEIEIKSFYKKKRIIIDGLKNDWEEKGPVAFFNNDNRISFLSQWDTKNLYIIVVVKDKSVISHFKRGDSGDVIIDKQVLDLSKEDDIELFFDPGYNHRVIRDKTHKQFLFSPAGMFFQPIHDSLSNGYNYSPALLCSTRVYGTLNNDRDLDTGYVVEMEIPWKILGVTPFNNQRMGFEVWNDDKDFLKGDYFYSSWSGVEAPSLQNPSEWGNIKLVEEPQTVKIVLFFLIGFSLIAGAGIVLYKYKKQKKKQVIPAEQAFTEIQNLPLDKEEVIFRNAMNYIKENFTKDIGVEDVVKVTYTNSTTFFKIFKDKTGQTFVQYLTQMRIERAKYILKNTKLSVSEVSLESGFNSLQYFDRAFRKDTGVSPLEYRRVNTEKT